MPDEAQDWQEEVWADEWNPEPNVWAPSQSPYPVATEDDPTVIGYQSHADVAVQTPISEMPGQPDPGGGSVPSPSLNLLTDVTKVKTAPPPPPQVVQHEVHTYETGAEIARVRQVNVTSSVTPLNLLEENPDRKRALLRIVPQTPATVVNTENNNLVAVGVPATITVPAGQTWLLQSIAFLFTADAVVANRTPRVVIKDAGGRVIYEWTSSVNVAANQVAQVVLAPGMPLSAGGAGTVANPFTPTGPLPATLVLTAGESITADAIAEDPGDTITNGVVNFTQTSIAGGVAGLGSVFIAPRSSGGSTAQASSWFKLNQGDAPIELKTQEGIDVILDPAQSLASVVQVYEELAHSDRQVPTGIV